LERDVDFLPPPPPTLPLFDLDALEELAVVTLAVDEVVVVFGLIFIFLLPPPPPLPPL